MVSYPARFVVRPARGLLGAGLLAFGASALLDSCFSPPLPFPPSSGDVASFVGSRFDVIIAGGGTAGVALAARLTEDPRITVGIIEAGRFHFNDPIVDVPQFAGKSAGNPDYDWNFQTVDQASLGGRSINVTRGKLLGGSSGVNRMAWTRASHLEYDAWVPFSSADWSFQSLLPFFDRSENISRVPNPYPGIPLHLVNRKQPAAFTGSSGTVQAGHDTFYPSIVFTVAETLNSLGITTNPFPQVGSTAGLINLDLSINVATGMRSYSAKAYYCRQPFKPNLKIITGAQVTKVLFNRTETGLLATGIQFSVNSTLYEAYASKEIVLSAGSLQTPHILELSGIGNSSILSRNDIPVLIDLPLVGENLQEHPFSFAQFQLNPEILTYDVLNNNVTFAEQQMALYNATGLGVFASADSTIVNLLPQDIINSTRHKELLAILDSEIADTNTSPLKHAQLLAQREFFVTQNVPAAEIIQWSSGLIPQPNQSYVTVLGGLMHPISRGSVHLVSADPLEEPVLDLGFLNSQFDRELIIDIMKYVFHLGDTLPFKNNVSAIDFPPAVPARDAEVLDYVKQTVANGGHIVGTAAMAPRSQGGIVDEALKVYGTLNLHVVDASIIPLEIAAHTQATVYAIAEKAADIIRRAL